MRRIPYIIIPLLLLTGCSRTGSVWSLFREIEDLQLVQTLGYDTENGDVRLSVSSGAGTEELPPVQLAADGRNIPEALDALEQWSTQDDLYFAHIRYCLVGESAAEEGIRPLLDWLERSPQTRLDVPLLVVENGSAAECVFAGYESGDVTQALFSLQRSSERQGSAFCYTAKDAAVKLSRSGAALCCSLRAAEADAHNGKRDTESILCSGFAVLTENGLCCFTGEETAHGICLLSGQAGSAVLTADTPGGSFSAELTGNRVSLQPQWSDSGAPALSVGLRCTAAVTAGADVGRAEAEAALSALVRERVVSALTLSRETGADFLELGCLFARDDPARFAALDWPAALRSLPLAVDAALTIESGFDLEAGNEI